MPTKAQPIPPATWPSREAAAQSLLFGAGTIGALGTRTRSWVPAMVPWRSNEKGEVTPDVLDWYGRFARGKPGVLVVEATGIREVPSGPLLRIGHDRYLPGLEQLCARVREESGGETRLFIQLIDFLTIRRRPESERYFKQFLQLRPEHRERMEALGFENAATCDERALRQAMCDLPQDKWEPLLAPREFEDLTRGYRERVDDLHLEHIAKLPEVLPSLFAQAAIRAQKAGFDGVELHYAHAYTMASFLSRTNQRNDGYGASPAGRVRLPLEVFAAVRDRVGDDFPVGCRFLGDEVIAGGSRIEDACEYGLAFARAGMDFLSVSKGGKFDDARRPKVGSAAYPYTGESGHECMPTVRIGGAGPFGRNLHLAAAIRQTLRDHGQSTPVVAAGGINSFELAERALAAGDCDFVAAARQSLADPDWFLKIELGLGHEVRRCLFTNYCEGLDQKHLQVTCQLWDRDFPKVTDRARTAHPVGESDLAPKLSSDGRRRLVAPDWSPEG